MAILKHDQDVLGPVSRDEHVKDGSKARGVVLQALGVPAIRASRRRYLPGNLHNRTDNVGHVGMLEFFHSYVDVDLQCSSGDV